jgi:hypothetical protein
MRQECPAALCRQRALSDSLLAPVKRKLSARAPGCWRATQCLQAWLLGVASKVYRLAFHVHIARLRMSTEPARANNVGVYGLLLQRSQCLS